MVTDLAAQLANAIVKAAIMAAGNHADYSPSYVRSTLATDLRRILPACYFCSFPARTLEAGYAVCEPMFHAGQRERLEDVAPAAPSEWCIGHDYAPVAGSCPHNPTPDRHSHRIGNGRYYHHAHEYGGPHSAIDHATFPGHADVERQLAERGDYSAPDYTPDERHRHTIGGQTWEHAHEGGHEAHQAFGHDLSTAELLDACGYHFPDPPCRQEDCPHCYGGHHSAVSEARPEPPSAVSMLTVAETVDSALKRIQDRDRSALPVVPWNWSTEIAQALHDAGVLR